MLFGWSKPPSPIPEEDRLWIEHRLTWLCEQFGRERLQFGTVVLPTADFFPEAYQPTEEGVRILLRRVGGYMGGGEGRGALGVFFSPRAVALHPAVVHPPTRGAG